MSALRFPLLVALVLAVTSCKSTGGAGVVVPAAPGDPTLHAVKPRPQFSTRPGTRNLVVLHTSDNESDLLGERSSTGETSRFGGIGRLVTLKEALVSSTPAPTLVVAAGDTYIPSPELKVKVQGKSAIAKSNALIGYHASAIGNHELDLGDSFFADFLDESSFPYLSATVSISRGALFDKQVSEDELQQTGGWSTKLVGRISPRAKVCLGTLVATEGQAATCEGEVIGLIGATTPNLRMLSSPSMGLDVVDTLDEVVAAVQQQVDHLEREGVNAIVLLSHMQDAAIEANLVRRGLRGVDIIVAGGGDNRLADTDHRLLPGHTPDAHCLALGRRSAPGDEAGYDCYPVVLTASDGYPVLLVASDGRLRYWGYLSVTFDDDGVLTRFDEDASRPWPVDEVSLVELRATPSREAIAFEHEVRETLSPLMHEFARTNRFLEGRREEVRNRETNLGNLAADSMIDLARSLSSADASSGDAPPPPLFALRNAGGIRAPIGDVDRKTHALLGGPIRLIDLESSLRFDGDLVVVTTSHQALKETLESSLRGAGTGRGRFPQVSAEVFLEYDTSLPEQQHVVENGVITGIACPGQRIYTLRITPPGQAAIEVVKEGNLVTPDLQISFVTLRYLAKGGDGWFPGTAHALEQRPLGGGEGKEQRALQRFIEGLDASGRWENAAHYPDPIRGQPSTFLRIREVAGSAAAQATCQNPS